MPSRLRPTASLAADAILVGDPGRALLLAQELLEQPKMSNHARGLWGYSGRTAAGRELTIQSTGMGGPSAALVLADLAELGVERAVRVGTCIAIGGRAELGELLLPREAIAAGGSAASFGLEPGQPIAPDGDLLERLARSLEVGIERKTKTREREARAATLISLDHLPGDAVELPPEAVAADMQTVAILARGRSLRIAAAAILIVSEGDGKLSDDELELCAKRAGQAAMRGLPES